jgi:hypothetical protein
MRAHGAQLCRVAVATLAAIVAMGGAAPDPARAADATSVTVTSSVNPAPYGTPVLFTAAVTSAAGTPTGTVRFAVDGSPLGGPVALAGGFASSLSIATLAVGTHAVTAAYAPDDPGLFDPGSGSLVESQVVVRAPVILVLSATPAEWEVSAPIVVRATVVASAAIAPDAPAVALAATGTVEFSVDGGPAQAVPVIYGVAELPPATLGLGPHTVTATYSGDTSFEDASAAPLTRSAVANLVNASGVGVSGTAIYPIKDAWLDTISIRGLRNERLGVAIRVYSPAGRLVLARTIPAGAGAYASTWNGRNPIGALLPAGTYRIVQTLADPSTAPALTKSWTSRVALSTKQMTWKTATLTVAPGPRNYRFSSGEGVGPSSAVSAAALAMAGASGDWPAVGYEFTVPAASVYRLVRFQALGSASGTVPTLGLHRWSSGAPWGQVYRSDFARTSVTPSTVTWRGLTSTNPAPFITSTRRVRGYVDGGSRLTGPFRFGVTGVRLVVVYGVLR